MAVNKTHTLSDLRLCFFISNNYYYCISNKVSTDEIFCFLSSYSFHIYRPTLNFGLAYSLDQGGRRGVQATESPQDLSLYSRILTLLTLDYFFKKFSGKKLNRD